MTIADAPYIREAEMYGWGPEGDDPDYSEQVEKLKKTEELLDDAAEWLLSVEDDLKPEKVENPYREMMYKINDMAVDVRLMREKLERGHIE